MGRVGDKYDEFLSSSILMIFLLLLLTFSQHPVSAYRYEIMDQFRFSRCLNDHINLPNMIRLFASSAIASIMAKNGTKENFSNIVILDAILHQKK